MHWKNIRILLVDPDDSFSARTARAFQKSNNLAVLTRAHTLVEARARIAAGPLDVVITGLQLPDGTANDLLAPQANGEGLPVVVLIRHAEEEKGAPFLEAGAAACYVRDGRSLNDLPRVAAKAVREWHQKMEKARAESTITKLRSQVRQFQSLATSGLMARGLAHDVENLLTPILGYAELALEKIPQRGTARKEIEQVVRVTNMAKDLVRDAVQGNGNGRSRRQVLDIGKAVGDVLNLLLPAVPDGVEVRFAKSPEQMFVVADTARIYMVFLNLYTNAFDAMRASGGVLHVDVESFEKTTLEKTPDNCVRITVTDTGCGMNSAVSDHVFDPFFTTKGNGNGSGPGLSETREIIEEHGGSITVESEPGKGSVFQLMIPLAVTGADNMLRQKVSASRGAKLVL